MKLGKLKKALSILLIVGMSSSPVLATEVDMTSQATTSTEQVLISTDVSGEDVEEEEWVDYWREQEIQFIRKYGQEINASAVNDNVKITIEYVLADTYTPQFLIAIEKLDDIPFKSHDGLSIGRLRLQSKEQIERQAKYDEIPEDAPFVEHLKVMAEFDESIKAFINEDDTVDMDGLVSYLQQPDIVISGTSSGSYGMSHTKENTESKVYFVYKVNDTEPFTKEMIMQVEDIVVEEERTEEVAVDIVSYLKEHQEKELAIVPNTIDEYELERLERFKEQDEAFYLEMKEELESQPQYLLAERGLNMPLLEGDDSFVIDNIGFIDDKLHIMMLGEGANTYRLEVYDQEGDWVWASYNTGSTTTLEDGSKRVEAYRAFDISSVEELSGYTFEVSGREVIEEWPGVWEIDIDMSDTEEVNIIEVNEAIPYTVEETANLSEIHIGKISVALVVDQIESDLNHADIAMNIRFKDGTEEGLRHSGAARYEEDRVMAVYSLRDRLGEDIASIEIGDTIVYSVEETMLD